MLLIVSKINIKDLMKEIQFNHLIIRSMDYDLLTYIKDFDIITELFYAKENNDD